MTGATRPVHFDLTEQFLASGSGLKYYGIVRTVMEVGYEISRLDPSVRFVVFSPGHGRFFEVTPRLGARSPTGIADPDIPPGARPVRIRESYPDRHLLRDAALAPVRFAARLRNRRAWAANPPAESRPIDMDGRILLALGRPKAMSDYISALARRGERPDLHPFIHDLIPLHTTVPDGSRAGAGLDPDAAITGGGTFARNFLHDNRVVLGAARHALANSEFTRSDVLRLADARLIPRPARVTTVPLCHEMRPTSETARVPAPAPGYLMSVGILLGRKNLECAMEALMILHGQGRAVPRYVIAGARRQRVTEYVGQERFAPISDRVTFAESPNQEELRALYENALALLIPSRMEGWGLPLGEALWCGTPAIAARAPALDEVGGDLALYHDPDDPAELAAHVARLADDAPYRAALRARIAEARPRLRTWRDVAADMLAAIREGGAA